MGRPALDGVRLQTQLGTRWARIAVVAQTASTNADLVADATAPDRSVLVAEYQSAGRGRLDRTWTSPPRAGLTFSVLLRPEVPMSAWGWLPLLTGLALQEAVDAVAGLPARLKWPNDLLAEDGRKLAGILAQTAGDSAAVVGVGLNVDTAAAELPVETATSLALAGAGNLDRTDLLIAVLSRLDARYAQWSDCRGDSEACGLAAAYRAACVTIGSAVRVVTAPDAVVSGVAVGLDPAGRLLVRTPDGEQTVAAGDIEHVRPA